MDDRLIRPWRTWTNLGFSKWFPASLMMNSGHSENWLKIRCMENAPEIKLGMQD